MRGNIITPGGICVTKGKAPEGTSRCCTSLFSSLSFLCVEQVSASARSQCKYAQAPVSSAVQFQVQSVQRFCVVVLLAYRFPEL